MRREISDSDLASCPNGVIVKVGELCVGKHINAEAKRVEFGGRQILVLLRGNVVHLLAHGTTFLGQTAKGEELIGEGHVHHFGRMPFGGGEVDQAATC